MLNKNQNKIVLPVPRVAPYNYGKAMNVKQLGPTKANVTGQPVSGLAYDGGGSSIPQYVNKNGK